MTNPVQHLTRLWTPSRRMMVTPNYEQKVTPAANSLRAPSLKLSLSGENWLTSCFLRSNFCASVVVMQWWGWCEGGGSVGRLYLWSAREKQTEETLVDCFTLSFELVDCDLLLSLAVSVSVWKEDQLMVEHQNQEHWCGFCSGPGSVNQLFVLSGTLEGVCSVAVLL